MLRLILLTALVACTLGEEKAFEGFKVLEARPNTIEQIKVLSALDTGNERIDFWDPVHRKLGVPTRINVAPENLYFVQDTLNSASIPYTTIIEDVDAVFEKEFEENNRRAKLARMKKVAGVPRLDISYFWQTHEVYEYLDELAATYPDIIEIEVLGQTYEGRDIKAAKVSLAGKVDGSRPHIIVDGTIHAREWIGTMVVLSLLDDLVVNHEANRDILTTIDWIIVPILNPDGYVYTHLNSTTRSWRKNRRPSSGTNCIGVDPNRNFNIEWDAVDSADQRDPCSIYYKGSAPGTELEVQALSGLLTRWPTTRLYLAVHSYGSYILYPHAFGVDEPIFVVNRDEHIEVGQRVVDAIMEVYGYDYDLYGVGEVFGPAGGGADDYANLVGGANLSFTIELPGGGPNGYDINPSRIVVVVTEILPGLKEFGKFVVENYT